MRLKQPPPVLVWAIAALALTACSGSPQSLGITGPGTGAGVATGMPGQSEPGAPGTTPDQDDSAVQPPGNSTDFGNHYAPTIGPGYGSDGRYYGYN